MSAAFDLISAEYGWDDTQILDCTLRRLRQIVAAIQRRQWLDDLAHRRLETAKLRTVCAYIASTLQLAEGADNVMLTAAAGLNLGPGTEDPDAPDALAPVRPGMREPAPDRSATLPTATVARAVLPDAPTPVRPGQAAPMPPGLRELPLDRLGALFGGAL